MIFYTSTSKKFENTKEEETPHFYYTQPKTYGRH